MGADTMGHIDGLLEGVSHPPSTYVSGPPMQAQIIRKMTNTDSKAGPVTDYTSSMVQWMRHRQPRYKGGGRVEMERPSPSYAVDVCSFVRIQASADPSPLTFFLTDRCSRLPQNPRKLQIPYL